MNMIYIITLTVLSVFMDVSYGQIGVCKRVVCYMTSLGQYRAEPMRFIPKYVHLDLCTHVIYAFGTVEDIKSIYEEWTEDGPKRWENDMYSNVTRLKLKKPSLKVLLAIGIWGVDSRPFSQMVKTRKGREDFVYSSIDFLRRRSFDGIDIHWEYPTLSGGEPEDKKRFLRLLLDIRDAFKNEILYSRREKLLLTVGIGASRRILDAAYNVPEMARTVDFINIKSFNFHGAWDTQVGHNSPIYSDDDLSLLSVVEYFVSWKVNLSKLVIGLAAYGRHVYLDSPTEHAIGTKIKGPGKAGKFTKDPGALAYFEICPILKDGGKIIREPHLGVPYYYKNGLWLGYDDAESFRAKISLMKKYSLGGVMIWAIEMDDFNGTQCNQGKYPLLNAVKQQCLALLKN